MHFCLHHKAEGDPSKYLHGMSGSVSLASSNQRQTSRPMKEGSTALYKKGGAELLSSHPYHPEDFQETEEESRHFIDFIKDKVTSKDPDDVISMDQTPISFLFHAGRSIEMKGSG